MDERTRGLVDEDEDAEATPTDRAYWEQRASKATVALADKMLDVLREFDSSLNLKYNKFYIGLERDGRPYNFVHFIPRKNQLNVVFKLPQSEELDSKIDDADLDTLITQWSNVNSLNNNQLRNYVKLLARVMLRERRTPPI